MALQAPLYLLWLFSCPLFAQDATAEFKIPSQPLSSSILIFSQQADLQVFYRTQLGEGLTTSAVVGRMTSTQALQQLLNGTGLVFRFTDIHTVALFREASTQTAKTGSDAIGEVFVLGSYLKAYSQLNYPTPVSVIDRESMVAQGRPSMAAISQRLPFSSGSQLQVDNLAQPLTAGTAVINLRNLGLGSTMTLVNGHRQALSAVATTQGETFVDLNSLMPSIMIDRIEVLRGGASATYGSDAVAGVVNVVPRVGFTGVELDLKYQTTDESDQADKSIELLGGISLAQGDGHWVGALSYRRRTALLTRERKFSEATVTSSFGQPGTYLTSSELVKDPNCGVTGGFVRADSDFCLFDSSPYFDLSPEEERWQWYSFLNWSVSEQTNATIEIAYSNADITLRASPSFPFATSLPVVPTENPGNSFGEPVVFYGRVKGAEAGSSLSESVYQNIHTAVTLDTRFEQWSLSSIMGIASNHVRYGRADVVKGRLQNALNGMGGEQGNQTWNPLHLAYNPDGLAESFFADWRQRGRTQLFTMDMIATSDWFKLDSTFYALAVGLHYRREDLSQSFSELFNDRQFLALGGGPDFSAHRDVMSAFAELYWEITESVELQAAIRYENYDQDIDANAPKLAVLWRCAADTVLRASYSKAFRAPSLFQVGAVQSVPAPVTDGLIPGLPVFRNVLTSGSQDLNPESANVFSMGVSSTIGANRQLNLDVWYYDYKDIILKESAQDLLKRAAAMQADAVQKVIRDQHTFRWGRVRTGVTSTYVDRFDIQPLPGGGIIDGVGRRNATTPAARSLPQWRANIFVHWQQSSQQLRLLANYIDSYKDDKNNNKKIASHTTLDLHYQLDLDSWKKGVMFSAGVLNLFDRAPPFVNDFLGYDSKSHDPRGRIVYINMNYSL
jgi:iron complex outermembrane recepter protein